MVIGRGDDTNGLPEELTHERGQLICLGAHLTGNADAAEDLAQETLLVACHHADKRCDVRGAAPWLAAIVRTVCLRWTDRCGRELQHHLPSGAATVPRLADDYDLEVELERSELVALLDRALALLPSETRAVLVAR